MPINVSTIVITGINGQQGPINIYTQINGKVWAR